MNEIGATALQDQLDHNLSTGKIDIKTWKQLTPEMFEHIGLVFPCEEERSCG